MSEQYTDPGAPATTPDSPLVLREHPESGGALFATLDGELLTEKQQWKVVSKAWDALRWIMEDRIERAPRPEPELSSDGRAGWVYVYGYEGYYKIGKTQHLDRRLEELGKGMPFPPRRVIAIRTRDRHDLERSLHRHYAATALRGEWFKLPDSEVALLAARGKVIEL